MTQVKTVDKTEQEKIEGEHFQKVEHCLLGLKEVSIKQIKTVRSHEANSNKRIDNQCLMMMMKMLQ